MFRGLGLLATTAILLSLVLVACSGAPTGLGDRAPIQTGAPVSNRSNESVQRVVALTSLSSDILYQLDKTKLVGIPGSRLLTEDPRFKAIAVVSGDQTQPNLEKIVALKPDMVVGAEGIHDQTLQKLKELGIPTLTSKLKSWGGLEELTKNLAEAIAADPATLLARYQTFLPKTPPATSPSTLVLLSRQPILSPNKASWAGDLLAKFGAKNLAGELQGKGQFGSGYVTLSAEKILEANPDIVILVDREPGILESYKTQPFWNQLKASQNNRVYVFDYYGLVNPGSIDKILEACSKLREAVGGEG